MCLKSRDVKYRYYTDIFQLYIYKRYTKILYDVIWKYQYIYLYLSVIFSVYFASVVRI